MKTKNRVNIAKAMEVGKSNLFMLHHLANKENHEAFFRGRTTDGNDIYQGRAF